MDTKTLLFSIVTYFYGYMQVLAEYWKSTVSALFNRTEDLPNVSDEKMSGWIINEYGGINSLQFNDSLKLPVIKAPTDVLVEVYTTSLNPIDQFMTGGYGQRFLNVLRWLFKTKEFPLILGREFCGVVKAKGEAVRADIEIGDKVWGVVPGHRPGSLADYVVVDQSTISRKPEGIDDVGAAGTLFVGLTVWSSLYISGLVGGFEGLKTSKGGGKGLHICILGASGGVGTIAVQMAKAEEMIVTATCSTNSVQLVKDLGADHVIDYRTQDLKEAFRGLSFDVILDAAGLGPNYATTLPWTFNQYITLLPPLMNNTDANGLVFGMIKSTFNLIESNILTIYRYKGLLKWGFFVPLPQGIQYFQKQVESGKIKPIIDTVYEFDETKKAFEKMAQGHMRGKLIVKVKNDAN